MRGGSEAVLCSDPEAKTIRTTPSHLDSNMRARKSRSTDPRKSYFGRMRWFKNMIRHMNIDGVCFDCRIALMLARLGAISIKRGCEPRQDR